MRDLLSNGLIVIIFQMHSISFFKKLIIQRFLFPKIKISKSWAAFARIIFLSFAKTESVGLSAASGKDKCSVTK